MRVGVVCEGPTDFAAISYFLRDSLLNRGIEATFVDIQPNLDRTSSTSGGWPNALVWLKENPIAIRKAAFLGSGLFSGELSAKKCDLLLVQIDSDVLDEVDFLNYVRKNFTANIARPTSPSKRFDEVQKVLLEACGYTTQAQARTDRHIVAPAVENTEAWCVAVRDPVCENLESVKKAQLVVEFELRLLAFLGAATKRNGVKDTASRKEYCRHHAFEHARLQAHCSQYARLVAMF